MKKNLSSGIKGLAVALTTAGVVGCVTPKATNVQQDIQKDLSEQLHRVVPPEQDMRLVTTFDANKHVQGNLIVSLPASITPEQLKQDLATIGEMQHVFIPVGFTGRGFIFKSTANAQQTQQIRDLFAQLGVEAVFEEKGELLSLGAYDSNDLEQFMPSYWGDWESPWPYVSADADSLRAFTPEQFKNYKDDIVLEPGKVHIAETVKLALNEQYDPAYIVSGELAPIDTLHSENLIGAYDTNWILSNPEKLKDFSQYLGYHGTVVASQAVAKDGNGQFSRGTYNGGPIISWNCSAGNGISITDFLLEMTKAVEYVTDMQLGEDGQPVLDANNNPIRIPNGRGLVINASHALPGYSPVVDEVFTAAQKTGAIILSHGSGNRNGVATNWRASQGDDSGWVISVGATDQAANRRVQSDNVGSDYGDWVTTYFKGENNWGLQLSSLGSSGVLPPMDKYSGTSFSTPLVSGWTTLIWNLVGGPQKMSPAEIKDLIASNKRIMVQQPDTFKAKPRFHVWDIVGRTINDIEEKFPYQTPEDALTRTIDASLFSESNPIDLNVYTHDTLVNKTSPRYPWMTNVTYSLVKFAPDGKTVIESKDIPNGKLNPHILPNGPFSIKIARTNLGNKGPDYIDVLGRGPDTSDTNSFLYRHMNIKNSTYTSVNEIALPKLAARPNPVVDNLNISLPDNAPEAMVVVYDLTGKEVYAGVISGGAGSSGQLNLSSLPSGMYTARVFGKVPHGAFPNPISAPIKIIKK